MEVIDTVPADCLEIGDVVRYKNHEIEIVGFEDIEDAYSVCFKGHNLSTGDVETYAFPFDFSFDILGA